jgi:2-phosphoglycerate kinase
MIYLIGGAPRVGKTTLAKMIMVRKQIPFLCTDLVRDAINEAFPNLNITSSEWKERAKNFEPVFKSLIKNSKASFTDFVVEGDIFFPAQVDGLKDKDVKCCYLGIGQNGEQKDIPEWVISRSEELKEECSKYAIAYFDVSKDREAQLERAYSELIGA